ncbi:MAG: methylated-DNA--[protein]-cysteine S-methyltransferase [Cyanobacteria bacterium J06573_11]
MSKETLKDKDNTGKLETDIIRTPVGDVIVVVSEGVLLALDFEDYRARMMKLLQKRFTHVELQPVKNPAGMSQRVEQYFAGELTALADAPMATGGTDFQRQVWNGLRQIAPGDVCTYGELANQLNNPKAVRAVGMANSLNPISIALPCHRVVGASGKLTGYAGGLARKQWLLAHEGWPGLSGAQASKNSYAAQLSVFSG